MVVILTASGLPDGVNYAFEYHTQKLLNAMRLLDDVSYALEYMSPWK